VLLVLLWLVLWLVLWGVSRHEAARS